MTAPTAPPQSPMQTAMESISGARLRLIERRERHPELAEELSAAIRAHSRVLDYWQPRCTPRAFFHILDVTSECLAKRERGEPATYFAALHEIRSHMTRALRQKEDA